MAQTVSFAIIGAFLLSLTYVPAMTALVLKRNVRVRITWADRIMNFLYRLYRPVLELALRWRYVIVALAVLVFAVSIWRFTRMGGEFIPTLEEGDLALHQILPAGSSIEQSVAVSTALQQMLLDSFPEIEKVVTKIGTAEIPTDIMPMEAGDIYVALKPKDEWTSASNREELFERMETVMSQLPGVMYEFTQPIQMRFNELMTGVRQDIAIKIYGDNLGMLLQKAEAAEVIIREVPGVGDIQVEPVSGLPQLVVRYRRDQLARYGVSVETVNHVLQAAYGGAVAGHIFEGERRFELVVRLAPEFRRETDAVGQLFVPLPDGGQVPLEQLAEVRIEEGPTQISRENTQRRIVIGVNARNRDVQSLVGDIRERLAGELDLPAGYFISYGGQFENFERARGRLAVAVPAALALIFILLYFTFGNLRHSLLVFTAIPLAAVGGIWALVLRGMPFSISAGVGFIALFGVAVLNGIVLIAYFNRLEAEGIDDVRARIREGARARLRPVVMTAAVASLGFLPMALSTTAGAEVQRPLATVVIGGLLTATLLTLVLLPVLYDFVEGFYRRRRIRGRGQGTNNILPLLLLLLFLLPAGRAAAQEPALSLNDVLRRIDDQPAVMQAALQQQGQQALEATAGALPAANVFLQGEEWRPGEAEGIHGLQLNQFVYWPGYVRSKRNFLEQQTAVAGAQLAVRRREAERRLRLAYEQLRYADGLRRLAERRTELYSQFVNRAEVRARTGETGRAPLLAAQTSLASAELAREQAARSYQLAQRQLALWLGTDTLFAPADTLPAVPVAIPATPAEHPAVAVQRQQLTLAERQIDWVNRQYAPQIQLGGLVQTVNGMAPFFGYQLGLAVPLFRSGRSAQVQSAQLQVEAARAGLSATERELQAALAELQTAQALAQLQLERLSGELLPLAEEQLRLAEVAYRSGEYSYLAYAQSIEQLLTLARQRLDAAYEYERVAAELSFWR